MGIRIRKNNLTQDRISPPTNIRLCLPYTMVRANYGQRRQSFPTSDMPCRGALSYTLIYENGEHVYNLCIVNIYNDYIFMVIQIFCTFSCTCGVMLSQPNAHLCNPLLRYINIHITTNNYHCLTKRYNAFSFRYFVSDCIGNYSFPYNVKTCFHFVRSVASSARHSGAMAYKGRSIPYKTITQVWVTDDFTDHPKRFCLFMWCLPHLFSQAMKH